MCGIAGLFLIDPALEPALGRLLAGMLEVMSDRGPDSTGFALYGDGADHAIKLTLHGLAATDYAAIAAKLGQLLGAAIPLVQRDDHAVLSVPADSEQAARKMLSGIAPDVRVVASGTRMELFKGVGLPADVSARYRLCDMAGTHAIGHTRMATESAVTTEGAHPFSTGPDQCLVHNGSLSNHNGVRRRLERAGLRMETENDTEVAAGYLTWRMREGARLDEALHAALDDLDGFYTFVVGTENGFGVLRDPVACKPAVMAETGQYVAFATEYRALVDLPGIETARLFEPEPARVYFWEHRLSEHRLSEHRH
jgi:glutamate synthase domain-containing protein 1